MQPHLFADSRPPHVHVAALGDLGGAIGRLRSSSAGRGRASLAARLEPATVTTTSAIDSVDEHHHGDAGGAVEQPAAAVLAHHVRASARAAR